jgi:ribosome maturation factor RimP
MADVEMLRRLIEPVVEGLGFAPVRVQLKGATGGLALEVMAEDPATGQLTLDQCAAISRAIDPVLDAADPIEGEYRLEVSSPGIDRPLTRPHDWARWVGHRARVALAVPMDGRKRFDAALAGLDGTDALLDVAGQGVVRVPLGNVASAKLVLTDALIASSRPLSMDGADTIVKDRR